TIQSSMLARRILATTRKKSCRTCGQKTFVFTDDLEIHNSPYHLLCDTEGWRSRGQTLYVAKPPLPSQRLKTP
ncbi:hypothetical protein, partial [Escherichia coli]|uniref:hypothetical protein n=1 Tax=Escherichia coli TaxID=562 RepID=UPI00207C979D